ncbi:uncharacterized protein LOC143238001 isoform X2 [Tachypleus tridentatus]|uniref:uncharacterized protein LOC143238001 isoform X2 n=1 Tax=Tachypleus tridentatus TaxID=6853 RepID=UPI003FD507EC
MSNPELNTNSEKMTDNSTSHSRHGSKYSMTLRSRCQDDCCAGPAMEFGRLTPTRKLVHRYSSSRSPSVSRRRRQNHTHHQAASTIVSGRGTDPSRTHFQGIREERAQKEVAEQVQKVVEEKTTKNTKSEAHTSISKRTSSSAVNNESIQTSSSKVKTSSDFGHHSYSDYSSGFSEIEDDIKTGYTYAASASYCTSVRTEDYESPNMSRCRLHFTRSSSSLSPTELDGSGHSQATRGVKSKTERFQSENEIHNSNKLGMFSTYSFDSRKQKYNLSNRHRNKEHAKIFKKLDYIYGVGEEQDSKVNVSNEHKGGTFNSIKPVSQYTLREWLAEKARWLWHYIWIHLYKLVSHVLLLDTWFLSRFSRVNRKFLLLTLLPMVLLLLYLCGLEQGEEVHMVSGPLGILSSLSSSVSFMWPKRELKTSDQQITTEEIQSLVSKVLRQEVNHWTKQMVTEQESYRHKQAKDMTTHTTQLSDLYTQVETILSQFHHVNEEVRMLRTKDKTDDASKMETAESQLLPSVTISQLDNKLAFLEHQIKGLQDIMAGMKNCCRNQSEYLVAAEKHITFLLTQKEENVHHRNAILN